jgi:hypothetical protein
MTDLALMILANCARGRRFDVLIVQIFVYMNMPVCLDGQQQHWSRCFLCIMCVFTKNRQVSCGVRDGIKEQYLSLSFMDVIKGD